MTFKPLICREQLPYEIDLIYSSVFYPNSNACQVGGDLGHTVTTMSLYETAFWLQLWALTGKPRHRVIRRQN